MSVSLVVVRCIGEHGVRHRVDHPAAAESRPAVVRRLVHHRRRGGPLQQARHRYVFPLSERLSSNRLALRKPQQ